MSPPKAPACPQCKPKVRMVPFTERVPRRGEVIAGLTCPQCSFRRVTVRARGIVCRRCGGPDLPIIDTERDVVAGAIFRYRECPACGNRVKTKEVEVPYVRTKATPEAETACARVAV